MANLARYLSHPQVQIDPDVAVPDWGLSVPGRVRTEALANAGWLRGTTRIVSAVEAVMAEPADGDTLFVGHGGVGTLLYCHFAGAGIDLQYDQPSGGGGNYLTIGWPDRQLLHGWRPMEFPPDAIFDSKTAIG